jgi:holliday junction DNA helicase RuvA
VIGRLSGKLLEKNPPQIVLDVQGVGYELDVPMSTFYNLPALGENVSLLTHFAVREDGQFLYGFATALERVGFRQLLKISGIGAKIALAVLSGLSVNELANAVARQDVAMLTRVPGIGKKTAERMMLELKDKLPTLEGVAVSATGSVAGFDVSGDILNALLALGYNEKEASAATKDLSPDTGTSDGIRLALKRLSKF